MHQITYADYTPQAAKLPVWVLLDDVETPRNAGIVFRIADTLGIEGLVLCGITPNPNHKLLTRTAKGADRHVPSVYFEDATAAIQDFRDKGYTIVALEITNKSVDVKTVDFPKMGKILLIAGAENKGISQAVLDVVDVAVHIPTAGLCLSMNVAVSVAIAIYEIRRQIFS
jgi:tRNA G18 (ribose-2'-O)-methylase SpoU